MLPPAQLKLVPPPRRPGICHSQRIANLQPQHQLAQTATATGPYAHHISNLVTVLPTTGKQGSLKKLLQGSDTKIWTKGLGNEWSRLLLHGLGLDRPPDERITGTGTIFFIKKSAVPHGCKVTYANFVCNIRPQKTKTHGVRMTAGGDKLDYPGDPSAPTVSMLDAKIHINSTISDTKHRARHLGLDIKNYFLGTPMAYYQYIRVPQPVIHQ